MILEKLIVENFRQFRGKQQISFSTASERNVTIVHAENGFGKTALLNALLWGFYGHEGLTEDLPKKESLIHEGVVARSRRPATTSAKVTIYFSHDSESYRLERELTLEQQRDNACRTDLVLEHYKDGMSSPVPHPQKKINVLMPREISAFLFFNGEGIEHLAREENSPKVTHAIRQMLGLELLRIAVDDLRHQSVLGKLRAELRERASDEKAKKIDEQTSIEEEIAELITKKQLNASNSEGTDKDLAAVNARLELNREAHALQTRRNELEQHRSNLEKRLASLTKALTQLVADNGFSLFGQELIDQGRRIMNDLRTQGKIPARVLNVFLQELLDAHRCICTGHLAPGTPERAAVESLMTYAGDQQFNNAVGEVDNALGRLEESLENTRRTLNDTSAERLNVIAALKIAREELADIHHKLGGKADEEVHELERKRAELLQQQRELATEQGKIDFRLEDCSRRREELRRQIKELEDSEVDAQRSQRRLDAVEESASLLTRLLEIETEDLRPLLNKEIDEHFRKIIGVGYWAELSDAFELKIMKRLHLDADDHSGGEIESTEVALSQGQRQVTSLVFIASLVALARRRSEIPTILKGLSGSEYPMVMDSPFGQLSQFRPGVARWIPELAPQVILFVSSTQYEGAVATELKKSKRVGKRYHLSYHGPNIHEDAKRELSLGKGQITVYHEDREEFTEIHELSA